VALEGAKAHHNHRSYYGFTARLWCGDGKKKKTILRELK